MKTILFYEYEAKPHPFLWDFHQWSKILIDCLWRLEHSLIMGFCPNYFMSGINQFESCFPPEEGRRLAAEVQHLKNVLYTSPYILDSGKLQNLLIPYKYLFSTYSY